jgi:putative drug exporter of the RND superfamily
MLDTLGRIIGRSPWTVIWIWVGTVILACAAAFGGLFGQPLFERLSTGAVAVPGQTKDGTDLLYRESLKTGPTALLILQGVSLDDPVLKQEVASLRQDVLRLPHVATQQDPFAENDSRTSPACQGAAGTLRGCEFLDADSAPLLSDDKRSVLVIVGLKPGLDTEQIDDALAEVGRRMEQVAPRVSAERGLVGGLVQITNEVNTQVEVDLQTGEGTALPISLVIMIVVFGGFLAAMLPILGALAAIAGAMATLLAFSYVILLDASTVNVVTVLGLGLCIDYGLLLVSRYREEMVNLPGDPALPPTRRQRELALRRTMSAAGRTVLFSGVTVAVSLCGLMVYQANFLRAIGAAGVSVVAVAVLVALTLVPAMLSVVKVRMIRPGLVHRTPVIGRVARRLGDVAPEEGVFSSLARVVQRFPVLVLMIVLAALFVATLPVLRMELTASGVALLPKDAPQRQLFDTLESDFKYAATPAVTVVANTTAGRTRLFVQELESLPAVISVDPVKGLGVIEGKQLSSISVRVAGSEGSQAAQQVVRAIRQMDPGYQTWTTGNTSALIDYVDDLKARTPLALGIVVLATFVLLFLMTGSVLVPVKALLMNVVSLGASLGVLVWVFQDGNFEGLLNFTSAGGIETFIPPMTLAFGFGLAMDYEVFLLSRIAEYRRQGYRNNEAVVMGLQQSGRIITSAALIIVVVFAGFIFGKLLIIKQTGLALAVAVAVDATLVRMLLVPATMSLLGEWNWWAPPALRRLHDRFGLREED